MKCFVYRSTKKTDTYIYVLKKDQVSHLPDGLRKLLGRMEYALEVDLEKTHSLANADIAQVVSSLKIQGYFLQLPQEHHISV